MLIQITQAEQKEAAKNPSHWSACLLYNLLNYTKTCIRIQFMTRRDLV